MQTHAITASGVGVIFPKVSRKLEEDRQFSLWRITKLAMASNSLLSTALAVVLLFFGKELLIFWLGASQAQSVIPVFPYLVFAYWILALNVAPHYILLSLGRFRFIAFSNLFAGLSLTIIIPTFALKFDLIGIAGARVLYGVFISVNFIALVTQLQQKKHA